MAAARIEVSVGVAAGLAPEDRARLEEVVARAAARAAATAFPTTTPRPLALRGAPLERVAGLRTDDGKQTYRLASHQGPGQRVEVPVEHIDFEPDMIGGATERTLTTGSGDRIERARFPKTTVLQAPGNTYVYAGGSPYAVAQDVSRALEWGTYLFGGRGFAVLQQDEAAGFAVAGLIDGPPLRDLGLDPPKGEHHGHAGDIEVRSIPDGRLGRPHYYLPSNIVALVTPEGVALVDGSGHWTASTLASRSRTPAKEPAVPPLEAQYAGWSLLRAERGTEQRRLIAGMDRTMFALLPWRSREEYLKLLIEEGPDEQERTAIMELIRSARAASELEAMFALLRREGYYESLFRSMDDDLFGLLEYLGEFRPGGRVDWRYVLQLYFEMELVPSRERARDVWAGVVGWLTGTLEGIWFLLSRPGDVIVGLGHMAELWWLLEKARNGDAGAAAQVDAMISQTAVRVDKAVQGLLYAEELGTPYGKRVRGAALGAGLLTRLRAALLAEVLSWFVGVGEVKAALRAARVPEALTGLVTLLGRLGRLGRGAEMTEQAARLERVLIALARLAQLGEDEARIARVAGLLPEEAAGELARLAEAIDLRGAAAADAALLDAVKGTAELEQSVARLRRALSVGARAEERAGAALGSEAVEGLRRLLRSTSWSERALHELIDAVPPGNLADLLSTVPFVRPEHMAEFTVDLLKQLGQRHAAMAFLREAGSDTFMVVWGRSAKSWETMERLVGGVRLTRERIGDPVEFRRFLDRLQAGDVAAHQSVIEAEVSERLAQNRLEHLLGELDLVDDPVKRAEYAAQFAQLADDELRGLDVLAGFERGDEMIDDVLALDRALSRQILGDVASITGRPGVTVHGLGRALEPLTAGGSPTGPLGALEAAKRLLDPPYSARELWFEHAWRERGLTRHTDIVADIPARGMAHVEVKAYARAEVVEDQFLKDVVLHAQSDYRELLYLYESTDAGSLERVRRRMLELFRTRGVARQRAQGIDPVKAEAAFRQWLATDGVALF